MVILEEFIKVIIKDLVAFDSLEKREEPLSLRIPGYTLENSGFGNWVCESKHLPDYIWKLSSMEILSLYLRIFVWTYEENVELFGKNFESIR